MAQETVKKPPAAKVHSKVPAQQQQQKQQQQQQKQQQKIQADQQKQQKVPPAKNKQQAPPPVPKVTPPPTPTTTPTPPKLGARERLIVWADDNDVDLEDITFAVPMILSLALLMVFFLRKYIRWNVKCPSDNRIDGKTVIITGGNSGIGKATATELAKRGAKVFLGCRDKQRGEAVSRYIRNKSGNQEVYAYRLDLASLVSIKEFVDDFNDREPALHVLINNAAYMGPKATTEDGFERTFGVNYLGHFYLTNLLQDKLKRGAPSRVINVVSDSYVKGKIDFEDLAMTKYDIYGAYSRSKLAMVLFNNELSRRLSSSIIFSYGVHPGMVCTDLLRNWPGLTGNLLRGAARVLFKSPDDGCQTIVYCAVADKIRDLSGKVLSNCDTYKIKNFAKDKELGEKLWNTSLHLCGMAAQEVGQNGVTTKPEVEEIGSNETKKDK